MRIKIVGLVAAGLVAMGTLTGCGNMSMGMGNFTYEHAHIAIGGEADVAVDIEKWFDNETGIEVQLTDGTSVFCSEGSYLLMKDKEHCPLCNED